MIPPTWMTAWLQTALPARDKEIIAGDLLEEYCEVILPTRGVTRAHLWYIVQIFSFLRQTEWLPFLLRMCAGWIGLFVVALLVNPLTGVAAFLIGISWCGFTISRRSVLMWTGTAAALIVAAMMLALLLAFPLRHPPDLATPIAMALLLGTLSAFLGRCSAERMQEIVFPRLSNPKAN